MTHRARCVEDALQTRALAQHAERRKRELEAECATVPPSAPLKRVAFVVFAIEIIVALVVCLLLCLTR